MLTVRAEKMENDVDIRGFVNRQNEQYSKGYILQWVGANEKKITYKDGMNNYTPVFGKPNIKDIVMGYCNNNITLFDNALKDYASGIILTKNGSDKKIKYALGINFYLKEDADVAFMVRDVLLNDLKLLDESTGKIKTLDSRGLNMIANMERNISQIEYDKNTGAILSIPTLLPDVGYGHDINQKPMNPVPDSLNAKEALELLKKDMDEFEKGIANNINKGFLQNQFNALVSLRYNIGNLSVVNGLVNYLENGKYERSNLKTFINTYYDDIIVSDPSKEKYRQGWYNRTERFLNIFFDNNYGDMPIDAVNGRVII